MKRRNIALAAAALSVAWCGQAWADEAGEKALRDKLEEMQKQIDEMSKRMSSGVNHSDDELEQRVAELEKVTKKDQDGLFSYWKTGLKMDAVDGAFKLSIFGRIQDDFTAWDNDKSDETNQKALGPTNFSAEFRRVRLGAGGTIYKNVEYKAEFDFADQGNGTAAFTDVFVELKSPSGLPFNFRVGHFDEQIGLDHVTSSKYTTFTERGIQEAFVPARNNGVMVYGSQLDNHVAWFAGWARDTDPYGNRVSPARPGENNLYARLTGRPYVSEDGLTWVHLGVSASRRNPNGETVQWRSRPEVHVGPRLVDTGSITTVNRNTLLGLEAAANMGSLHAQAEMIQSSLDGTKGEDDHKFQAESIQVGYFLTGDNRTYDVPMARWNRANIRKNYGADGWGGWEIALRWSHIDLNDKKIEGGTLTDWTFGVNWYLNPNTRFMLDLIHFNPDREVTTGSGATAKTYDLKSGNALVASVRLDF